ADGVRLVSCLHRVSATQNPALRPSSCGCSLATKSRKGERGMLQIRRMAPQIGVEITGIDVKTIDEPIWNRIYQAWLDYNVMVVRDQDLTIPDFIRYSERFGPVTPHPRNRLGIRIIPKSRCSASTSSTTRADCATRSTGAGPRAGTPTAPITRRRSRRRSST